METCPSGSEGGRAQQCARPTRPIRAFDCRRSPGGRVGASRDGEQTCQPVRPCSVRTCSTYNFKGALRAPGPRLVAVQARAPRDNGDGCRAAQRPPIAGWPPEDRGAPGAGCLPLAPSGHVGAGAHLVPATEHMGSAPQRQRWRAGLQTGPSLRRPHSEALRARGQDRSLALASLRDPFGPLDRSAAGIQGRLSEGWPGPSATPPVAAVGSSRPGLSRLIAGHEYDKSARHAPSWPHWPYLRSSGSRVRILPGAPLPGAPGTTPSQTKISRRLTPTFDPAKGGAGSPAVAATSPPPGRRHRIGRAQPPRRVHLAGPCRSPSGRRCAMASPT